MVLHGVKLLCPFLFMCVLHLAFLQWKNYSSNPNASGRILSTAEELAKVSLTDISTYQGRNLNVPENYELVSDGYCADSNGRQFDAVLYMVDAISPREKCAAKCDSFASCRGFDINLIGFCYVYFSDGDAPAVTSGSLASYNPEPSGVGDIFSGNERGVAFSCFKKSVEQTNHEINLNNYDRIGQGYCRDAQQNKYKYLGFELGPFGTAEDCANKCDAFERNQGFMWLSNNFCMCHFNSEDLPFNPRDAATLVSIPGAARNSGGKGSGRCEIHDTDDQEGHECYRHKHAPICVTG